MGYTLAAIVEREDVDETFVPRIVDKSGSVAWSVGEGTPRTFTASGLTVYRHQVGPANRILRVRDISLNVYVTCQRLVAVCRHYDKGGGWVGGAGAMVVANAVSRARATIRSHGKFLVAQVRWPWLVDVLYAEKTDWKTANQLRISSLDESGRLVIADLTLPKDVDSRAVARAVLAVACADRRIAEPELPTYDRVAKRFVGVHLANAQRPPACS